MIQNLIQVNKINYSKIKMRLWVEIPMPKTHLQSRLFYTNLGKKIGSKITCTQPFNLHPEKIFFQVDSLQKNQGFQDLNLFLIYCLNPAFFRLEILKNIRVCRTLISQIKEQINRLTRGIHEVNQEVTSSDAATFVLWQ